MFEIRFHGRGGQGVVLASRVLASAFFKEGNFVQAFPSFGAERRGAPVIAYARADGDEIKARYGIYKPDCVIVLDQRLTKVASIAVGLKKEGWIIINSDKKPSEYRELNPFRIATIDATSIARRYHLGRSSSPMVNTTILGAFPELTRMVSIDSILESIRENVPSKPEDNAQAALEASRSIRV